RRVRGAPPPARPGAVYRPSGVRLAAMGPADDLRDLLVPGSLAPLGRPADPLELEDPLVRESQVVGEKEIERLARAALPREMQKDRAKAVRGRARPFRSGFPGERVDPLAGPPGLKKRVG